MPSKGQGATFPAKHPITVLHELDETAIAASLIVNLTAARVPSSGMVGLQPALGHERSGLARGFLGVFRRVAIPVLCAPLACFSNIYKRISCAYAFIVE
jgi:hypothetical protein